MPRARNKPASHQRRKKILNEAKGSFGKRGNVYTVAKHHVDKGLAYAYTGRKLKKREYRSLWISRINAAARLHGTTYSKLIAALDQKHIEMNRKVLADLAASYPDAFAEIVKLAVA